jgi:hypothetical protein
MFRNGNLNFSTPSAKLMPQRNQALGFEAKSPMLQSQARNFRALPNNANLIDKARFAAERETTALHCSRAKATIVFGCEGTQNNMPNYHVVIDGKPVAAYRGRVRQHQLFDPEHMRSMAHPVSELDDHLSALLSAGHRLTWKRPKMSAFAEHPVASGAAHPTA